MPQKFSTKAGTLASLQRRLQHARIAPLVRFTLQDWHKDAQACINDLEQKIGSAPWVVRSSCAREDTAQGSNAGAFLSLLHVQPNDLTNAIEAVIAAYGEQAEPQDEVLIQPLLQQVVCSGVAFSHDPNTCAPYRIINWHPGEDTAAVTGGSGGHIWQQAALSPEPVPEPFQGLVRLLEELLDLFGQQPLDCEFALTQEAATDQHPQPEPQLWLLQVRPLLLSQPSESPQQQAERLKAIADKVQRGMQPHPFLLGQRSVYGVMPDWNPAEIIGVRPKPLALSLYRELVTDAIWAYQRHNYGYRNLRSFPLMPHFYGLPYIDARLSFNSFIPADLDEGVAGRLVDYYIERLLAEPTLHDKVEFEIVFSCYTLDLPQRLECLQQAGFSATEREAIAQSLRSLTQRIVHPEKGLWRSDAAKLDTLQQRREMLQASAADPLERIYWLLEDAKRYGTLPFAGLARVGFMAVQMLRSLVAVGVFSQADYDTFLASVSTISGQLARDRATLDPSTFLARYGHLRPGTYDLLSPRYDEAPDLYFDWSHRSEPPLPPQPFALTLPQMREIARLLKAHGLSPDPVGLFDFMQSGIELRELAKFHFTRNLSDTLALVSRVGEQHGFSREQLAFCDISVFQELHTAAVNPKELLQRSIEQGQAHYQQTLKTSLPPLIADPSDVWAFAWPDTAPNFITQKSVTAPVVSCEDRTHLAGALVCIPNADPGFDWLFAHPIAGLITAWGGANSHMAIRAGELGLPAVIGAGQTRYQQWSQAQRLHLDCAGQRVEVLA